jgi:hypothetical protein
MFGVAESSNEANVGLACESRVSLAVCKKESTAVSLDVYIVYNS